MQTNVQQPGQETLPPSTAKSFNWFLSRIGAGAALTHGTANCVEPITSISGSGPYTITLGGNCTTAAAGALVEIGDVSQYAYGETGTQFNTSGGINFANSTGPWLSGWKVATASGLGYPLWLTNQTGNTFPFNGANLAWDLGGSALALGGAVSSAPTVTAYGRSGTTVSLTLTSAGDIHAGDYIAIAGDTADLGINGTWQIACWNNVPAGCTGGGTGIATFTSTVSGALAFTGTLTAQGYHESYFKSGRLYFSGSSSIYMNDENNDGFQPVLSQNIGNGQFTLTAPDRTNGSFIFNSGSATGANTALLVYNGTTTLAAVNEDGCLSFNQQCNATTPLLDMASSGNASCASQTPASGAAYFCWNAGQLYTKDSASLVSLVQMSTTHITSTGTGTGATAGGNAATCTDACNDNAGRYTVAASPTTATLVVTFAGAWANAPECSAVDETTAAKNPLNITSVSTSGFTATGAATLAAADKISYRCAGAY